MKKTVIKLIQSPTDVEFTCPYCEEEFNQKFEEFVYKQGLSCADFSDWDYIPIVCFNCGEEIEVSYEFD